MKLRLGTEILEVRTLLAAPADFLNLTESLFVTEADAGGVNEAGDAHAEAVTVGDFNADGFVDLVVGTPGKTLDGMISAGAVSIHPGSEGGIVPGTGITITQTAAGEVNEVNDLFGAALAVGDFNGDLADDLAVGAPGKSGSGVVYIFLGQDGVGLTTGFVLTQEDGGGVSTAGDRFGAALGTGDFHGHLFLNGLFLEDLAVGAPGKDGNSGAVYQFTASETGLTAGSFFTQADFGGDHVAGDQFGAALESGHFDGFSANVDVGNGFADLAVGTPGEDSDTGAVYTFYGVTDGSGLDATTVHVLTLADVGGANDPGDRFGAALGVGDANNDGIEELAAGAPGKAAGAGAVAVFVGAGEGFILGGLILTQENAGGVSAAGDEFGEDLAFGVLDQNNSEELVVGAPGKDASAGAAYVFEGVDVLISVDLLSPGFMITQADAGGVRSAGDRFGFAMAIEDFNDNNAADLAVGAPLYASGAGPASGAAFVFPGVPISPPRTSQVEAGGINEAGDEFGAAQVTGDFNGDGLDDLAVGAPGEVGNSGAVSIYMGTDAAEGGVTDGFFITQTDAGGANDAEDRFGAALTVGDFNGDGYDDLAVGTPGETVGDAGTDVVTFQQGISGYSGTVDTRLEQTRPNDNFDVATNLRVDLREDGGPVQGLLRFDDIFGSDLGQIPENAQIVSATLEVRVTNSGDPLLLHRMLQSWSDTDTWNTLSAGIQADDVEAASSVDATTVRARRGRALSIDVTSSLQAWQSDVSSNYGWALLSTGINGVVCYSAEGARAPRLSIEFIRVESPVYLFYGSADGITAGSAIDVGGDNGTADQFGAALTSGDFNGDLVDDLAVGAPGQDGSGAVFVFSGTNPVGLLATPGFMITQADAGEVNETNDQFGAALTAGDFDADGLEDLAVGAPGESMSGAAFIFSGSDAGITTGYVITQPEIGGELQFGAALVAGDVTADGFADLVVGAPGKDGSGAIFILPGSEIGLSLTYMGTQMGSGGANEAGDLFGTSLTEGDFDGDGLSDLVVGAPGESPGLDPMSGAVYILPNGEVLAILEATLPTHHGQIRPFLNLDAAIVVTNPGPRPVADPQTVTFQQGNSGYSGTVDTNLEMTRPDTDRSPSTTLRVDLREIGGPLQGLLKFDDIFGRDAGQVPVNSQIQSARLEVWVTNSGNPLQLHRMLQDWSDTDTWNTLSDGIQADDEEAVSIADVTTGRLTSNHVHSLDVTSSLQAWQSDVSSNYGWAVLSTGVDGAMFYTAEGATPPRLIIDFIPIEDDTVVATGDFNGDGFGDLASGASGSISIYYGAEQGLTTSSFSIDQAVAGEVNLPADLFGASMVNLDLNSDGFGDLVVGAPGKALGADPSSGAIFLFYGSDAGFTDPQIITQIDAGQVNEAGDLFGAALESGDFNDDGFVDLVVGAPGKSGSGAVYVFYQSELDGITTGSIITQTDAGGVNESGDEFGAALAAGDFTLEGFEELVVGAPGKTVDGVKSGAVFVFTGSDEIRRELAVPLFELPGYPAPHSNFGPLPGFMLTQTDADGVNEVGDRFGAALAAGDMNGDQSEELVIGAPGKDGESGVVYVFQGPPEVVDPFQPPLPSLKETVLTLPGFVITQEDAGQLNEAGDGFGAVLTMGFLNNDLLKDLIVGAPGKDGGSGAVFVFPASDQMITNGLMITPSDVGGVSFVTSLATYDLNDDNGAELVVAGPGATVYVIPGVAVAPSNVTQTNAGGVNEAGDQFGAAMTAGDFNGNLAADLAVGAPGKNGGSGAVYIFSGSAGTFAHPTATGITSGVLLADGNAGAQFGAALAVGDFNADLFADLAVGAPGEEAVYVFYGSDAGLSTDLMITITQADAGGTIAAGDLFGAALTVGDFDGDGIDDLAVGAPGEDGNSGAVSIFAGSDPDGLLTVIGFTITQADAGGTLEADDQFGAALAAGDLDGDATADLAVGAPGEAGMTGAVAIFKLGITTGFVLTQADAGGVNDVGDRFGAALAVGDTNGDGFADLAVGAPGENGEAGNVAIFQGADGGIVPGTTTSFIITQELTEGGAPLGTTFYLETSEAGDQFGAALGFGDFDADGNADLVVGAPGEALLTAPASGAIFVFRGTVDGIKTSFAPGEVVLDTNFFYSEDGFGGNNEAGDRFGSAFVAGNFNADPAGFMDLAVGAFMEAPAVDPASGAVYLIPALELGA